MPWKWLLIVVLVSLPTFWSLLRPGYFPMHDDLQVMRVQQMSLCFRDLQFPCRWVPDMGYQYGYPQFEYYGPLPYYLMTAAHLTGLNLFDAVKFGFILALVLGNLTMFLLGRSLWGNWGGLVSALAYAYVPYRASDLYSRGAMGETWAFVFLPLIFYGFRNLAQNPTRKAVALAAASFAGLLVTHNISTLIFTPVILLWYFFWKRGSLKPALLSFVWGVGLAAFFFLPVIFEKGFAHTESLLSGYFNYLAHFVTLKQLFFTSFWGYGSSEIGPTDDLSFFLGPFHLLLGLVSLFLAAKTFFKNKADPLARSVVLIALLFFVFIFLTHARSTPIWKVLPLLSYLQFPWRFLVGGAFFLSLLAGYFISHLSLSQKKIFTLVFGLLFFFFNAAYFQPKSWFNLTPEEKLSGYSWDRQLTISIFDYLPIFAKAPPAAPAPIYPTFIGPRGGILDYQKTSHSLRFTVKARSSTTIELPQFDFPGWAVYLDGKRVRHDHQNDLGLITFAVPTGEHQIKAVFKETLPRHLANLLSLTSLAFLGLVLFRRQNV